MPKATCPSSPKLSRLGNLGTIGEGHLVSTPARPIKERPLLTMILSFENNMSSNSGYKPRITMWSTQYTSIDWIVSVGTKHFMFTYLKDGLMVLLASRLRREFATLRWAWKNMILPLSSGLKTHIWWIVPIHITQPSPTGIQAVISHKQLASW